jgi:hypothetical protein
MWFWDFGTKTLSVMKLELGTVMVNPSTTKKVWLGSHLFVSNEQIGFKSVSFFFFFCGHIIHFAPMRIFIPIDSI